MLFFSETLQLCDRLIFRLQTAVSPHRSLCVRTVGTIDQTAKEANCSTSGLWGSSMCKRPHCAHVFCHYRCMFPVGARKIWMVVNDLFIPIPRGLFCHLFIWRTFLVCCVWRSTCPHNFSLFVLKAHFSSHSPSWFSMQLQGNGRRYFTGTMRAWWSGQLRLFGILLEDF